MTKSQACIDDIVHLLSNYEQGLSDIFNGGNDAYDERLAEQAEELTKTEESSAAKLCMEDGSRVGDVQGRYLGALSVDQSKWFRSEQEAERGHASARKAELEVVEKHLSSQARSNLQEALTERCDRHVALLSPGVEGSSSENRLHQAEKARSEWTTEVCKAVIMEMRKEWRVGQRKVLQQLAGELRAERKAAADALERQIGMSRKVSESVKGIWSSEISQAQEELDEVAEAYKRALKFALEAKLREARQHAKEQAEFFQKEIREALLFEQQEHATHCAQLRRMRLAMLKWRFDYTADAKRKAAEFNCRGVLAKLAGLGSGTDSTKKKKKKKGVDPDMAQGEGGAVPGKKRGTNMDPDDLGELGEGEDSPKKEPEDEDPLRESSVSFKFPHSESESEPDSTESESEEELGMSPQRSAPKIDAVPLNEVEQELSDCRNVMQTLWSRLASPEAEAVDFLFQLEDLIPYEEEVLLMYEEECMRHGVMCTLDATDGRAEEALQADREAAMAKQRDTQEVQVVEKIRKKTTSKPGVPTVKRRVQLLP